MATPTEGPAAEFQVEGIVTDFSVEGNRLYVGTDMGRIEIFDLKRMKLIGRIPLPPVTTPRGGRIPSRVQSVDVRKGRVLVTTMGKGGYRVVWLLGPEGARKLVDESQKLILKEARFADDERVAMVTFGAEFAVCSLGERSLIRRKQIGQSTVGDMATEEENRTVIADESGAVSIVDTRSGAVVERLPTKHMDPVHSVAYAAGVTLSGGQDRKVFVTFKGRSSPISAGFPVFCVGISPDGKVGAYTRGDEQLIRLFDTATGRTMKDLKGHRALIHRILFLEDGRLISAERGPMLLMWRWK